MTTNANDALQQGMAYHQAGQLEQAEQIYRAILTNNQNDAMALHLYGLLMHQAGRSDAGAQMIERAIQLGLRTVESFNNLGECYRQVGRHAEAVAAYRAAIQCNPDQIEPIHTLGMLHLSLHQHAEALPLLERVAQLRPDLPGAHYAYAAALSLNGRPDDAIREWEQTLALDPNHKEAMKDLGANLHQQGRLDEAMKIMASLVEKHPDYVDGFVDYANALVVSGRIEEGIALANRAMAMAPTRCEPHHVLARAYRMMTRYDEALDETFKTLELNPDYLLAIGNIALIGELTGSYAKSIKWLEKAVEKHPKNAAFWVAISEAHSREGRNEEAVEVLDRAIKIQPDHPDLRLSRSVRLLAAGRFVEGFKDYGVRDVHRIYEDMVKKAGRTMWDGSDPAGKHLFVYAEQGFGDIIQFARYIPLLHEQGATMTIGTGREEICPLLRSMPGVVDAVVGEGTLPNYEFHVALMSLPCIFKTTLETVPNNIPYFHADESHIQKWKPAIEARAGGLKVGIVWGGRSYPDPRRSCSIKAMSVLSDVPNVSWYSLQADEPREELKDAPNGMNILDLGKDFTDFADTAAVLAQLDLVISIDTATAHLAGAMGRKIWMMVPFYADWRWFDKGDTSPWYPTMKLFRQTKLDDWTDAIQSIRQELTKLASEHKN